MTKFQEGYQEALQDVATALREGGLPAVEEWLRNNSRAADNAAIARSIRTIGPGATAAAIDTANSNARPRTGAAGRNATARGSDA